MTTREERRREYKRYIEDMSELMSMQHGYKCSAGVLHVDKVYSDESSDLALDVHFVPSAILTAEPSACVRISPDEIRTYVSLRLTDEELEQYESLLPLAGKDLHRAEQEFVLQRYMLNVYRLLVDPMCSSLLGNVNEWRKGQFDFLGNSLEFFGLTVENGCLKACAQIGAIYLFDPVRIDKFVHCIFAFLLGLCVCVPKAFEMYKEEGADLFCGFKKLTRPNINIIRV